MTFNRKEFEKEKNEMLEKQNNDAGLLDLANKFIEVSDKYNYGYQWTWLGMPIIQMPADMLVIQEMIYDLKPDLIIETGVAWGGSIVYYASILELIGNGEIVGVEKVLPQKNIDEIKKFPFHERIRLIEGSSIEKETVKKVELIAQDKEKVMVILDSNHTLEHVYSELINYASLVTKGSYICVGDTVVEDIPEQKHRERPWGKGNNPKNAVYKFLDENDSFIIEEYYNKKALTSFNPDGYLKKIK